MNFIIKYYKEGRKLTSIKAKDYFFMPNKVRLLLENNKEMNIDIHKLKSIRRIKR